jgi:hypothetical protein
MRANATDQSAACGHAQSEHTAKHRQANQQMARAHAQCCGSWQRLTPVPRQQHPSTFEALLRMPPRGSGWLSRDTVAWWPLPGNASVRRSNASLRHYVPVCVPPCWAAPTGAQAVGRSRHAEQRTPPHQVTASSSARAAFPRVLSCASSGTTCWSRAQAHASPQLLPREP